MLARTLAIGVALLAAVILAGCEPAGFTYKGSLAPLLATQQPVKDGTYVLSSDANAYPDTVISFALQQDGTYIAGATGGSPASVRFMGPIAGFYLLEGKETGDTTDPEHASYIIKLDSSGRLAIVDDAAYELMAELMANRLDIASSEEGATVSRLTDDPAINVALLQELIVSYRDRFVFELFLVPQD